LARPLEREEEAVSRVLNLSACSGDQCRSQQLEVARAPSLAGLSAEVRDGLCRFDEICDNDGEQVLVRHREDSTGAHPILSQNDGIVVEPPPPCAAPVAVPDQVSVDRVSFRCHIGTRTPALSETGGIP
jgi:hypothetical protein